MNAAPDWTDLARHGRTLEAIAAYRAFAGVGLGEAQAAVEEWLAANLPPSADYQRAVRIGRRVEERLSDYAARTGRELTYVIRVLAASPAEHFGRSEILAAELPEGKNGRDLVVLLELPGVSTGVRRQAALQQLSSGARSVWVIEVADQTIRMPVTPSEWYAWHDDATFDGGDVLPGFSCRVSDLFA